MHLLPPDRYRQSAATCISHKCYAKRAAVTTTSASTAAAAAAAAAAEQHLAPSAVVRPAVCPFLLASDSANGRHLGMRLCDEAAPNPDDDDGAYRGQFGGRCLHAVRESKR